MAEEMFDSFKEYDTNIRLLHLKTTFTKNTARTMREKYVDGEINTQQLMRELKLCKDLASTVTKMSTTTPYLLEWLCFDTCDMYRKSILMRKAYVAVEDVLDNGKPHEKLKAAEIIFKQDADSRPAMPTQVSISMQPAFAKLTDQQLLAERERLISSGFIEAEKSETYPPFEESDEL
jgi:hypothetical protein